MKSLLSSHCWFQSNFLFLLSGDPDKKLFSACQLENSDYLNDIGICIVEYLKHSESKTSYKPKKDEVVLASFEGSFFRAVCKEKVTDGYNVFYLDYGNSDMVKEADMRPIDKSLAFDVVTHSVYIENFPIEMDERQAEILQGNGIPIEDARKLKDGYVARITGL